MKTIGYSGPYPKASREPGSGFVRAVGEGETTTADHVASHIIETLDRLSQLARDTGQPDMAGVLQQAFHQCLVTHITAKAAQLSARIEAAGPGNDPRLR
ncbi:MAG TPA: hypothetical protein VG839_07350 [Asticcacaulis sp.]|nr:hypothetical protein [Asticcacaulis sp.]